MVSAEHNTDLQKLHNQVMTVTASFAFRTDFHRNMQRKKKLEKAKVAIAALVNYFYLMDCVDHVLEV